MPLTAKASRLTHNGSEACVAESDLIAATEIVRVPISFAVPSLPEFAIDLNQINFRIGGAIVQEAPNSAVAPEFSVTSDFLPNSQGA